LVNPASARDNLAAKYGETPEGAQRMIDTITRTAADEGLAFRFDTLKLTNTFQAHQVIHLAAEHGFQDAMKERLLRAYLSEGEPLGSVDTLVRLAAEVGLDADEVKAALEQQTYASAVRGDEAQAQAYGIGGVPFFVLQRHLRGKWRAVARGLLECSRAGVARADAATAYRRGGRGRRGLRRRFVCGAAEVKPW